MVAVAPMRVFVVDDDRDTTECMRLLIQHWGHDVHVANQGSTAIEQAPQLRPDVMLVDLGMPQVDGLTVARGVRQLPDLATTSLVALTGYADEGHRQQAIEAGFDEFLVKPLRVDALQALLERVRARVADSRERTAQAQEAAVKSRQLTAKSSPSLEEPTGEPVSVRIEKSGISDLILMADRGVAEYLRQWLHERSCRVGPVFEPQPGRVAFYTYSRRQTRSLLSDHPKVRLDA
ncbi:MAG TPA: response regulator [Pirellulales bacterium]|nr:response regulator [Pirellulales bacterium]